MKRVVIDTNVLIAGFRSRNGASFKILQMVADRRLSALVTTALFLEYEDVLKRPEQVVAHGMSLGELEERLAAFARLAEGVDIHFRLRPQLSDPKDEMVLEAAVNGRADALLIQYSRFQISVRPVPTAHHSTGGFVGEHAMSDDK